ncbi:16S rRNA (guanine(966)-N(2))-methyltransferase RsmD [Buchnera aphidicola]|uniref:16S rRNA (guanine(966)-N(2))-methyltransferase RsmD n=1 Tax=Buchnera aphidicola TaxID=9 RepID=UPI003463A397
MNKKIKIISGYLKGQIIQTINHRNLRPTTNRIRETLFNWIFNKLPFSKCLDSFSGSGSLGIEAISRYAIQTTFLEKNRIIIKNLKKNIFRLRINNAHIIHTNTLVWIKKSIYQYDIIFLDPPYYDNILQKTIILINKNKIIKNNGYIYIEMQRNTKIQCPKHWLLLKDKYTSNIHYQLYLCKYQLK